MLASFIRITLVFFSVVFMGCQAPVQDRVPQAKATAIRVGDGCLEKSLPAIKSYYAGQATKEETGATWECLSKSLGEFQNHVRGAKSNSFSAREVRSFIEDEFLIDTRISDALLDEVMRVKQIVLGGAQDRFTHDEIDQARALMAILKEESLRLLPHIQVLTMDMPQEFGLRDPKVVEAAIEALNQSMQNLAPLMGRGEAKYATADFEVLLRELDLLYDRFGGWDGPQWVVEKIPLIEAAKALLLYPEGSSVRPEEWRPLALNAARLYSLRLRSHYLMEGQSLLSGPGLDQLSLVLKEGMSLLEDSVKAKPEAKIAYEQINKLIDELYAAKIIDWRIKAATLQSMIKVAAERILSPRGSAAFMTEGMTLDRVARLHEMAFGWLEMQHQWKEVTKQAVAVRPALRGRVPLALVKRIWPRLKPQYREPYEDLARVFAREIPLTYGSNGDVVFSRDLNQIAYDQDAFNSLNWKQTLIRIMVQGYAANPVTNRYHGITKAEFEALFKDARALATDLNMVAPDDEKIWESIFEEASMFMLSARNDQLLSFDEGLEFLSFAMSSQGMSGATYDDLIENCLPKVKDGKPEADQGHDVFNYPIVEATCLRQRLKTRFVETYAPLATWATLARGWQEANEWDEFEKTWETAARKTGYDDPTIESSDVDRMSMVLHYIESIFTRFDMNNSGTLSLDESEVVFPLFRGVLAEASGYQDDEMLFAIFTYLLRYGEAPQSWDDKIFLQGWKLCVPKSICWRKVNADRRQLMKIVASVNSARAPAP